MTKKPFNKLLSIILIMAICVTTVFGCFVTANAADAPYYTVTGAECQQGDKTAKATVELHLPTGLYAARFKIDNTSGWYESFAATFADEALAEDYSIVTSDTTVTLNINIDDESDYANLVNTIVLNLAFTFKDGGITENVNITLNDLVLNGKNDYETYENVENKSESAAFTCGCQHTFEIPADAKAISSSAELGYTVYDKAVCSKCQETTTNQIVPEVVDNSGIVVYKNGAASAAGVSLLDPNSENSESNPYIIEYAEQLHALASGCLKNTDGTNVSELGAYFKVADGISAFVMQEASKYSADEIMSLSTAQEVFNKLDYETNKKQPTVWWPTVTVGKDESGNNISSTGKFSGHFDGNGVVVYGVYSGKYGSSDSLANATGLFNEVHGNTTIKNITVKNSYFATNSKLGVAALVGKTIYNSAIDTIAVENITIANNYIAQYGNHADGASAVIGYCYNQTDAQDIATINNCIVYGNILNNDAYLNSNATNTNANKGLKSGLITYGGHNNQYKITNVISIGVTPYTANSGYYIRTLDNNGFSNIFTDQDCSGINKYADYKEKTNFNDKLDIGSFKGEAVKTTASILDWNTAENTDGIWYAGFEGAYPTLLKAAEMPVADATNHAWRLLGTNIEYKNDGTFALNFHFRPTYESDAKLYFVNAENSAKTQVVDAYTDSSFADGEQLPLGAKMFTVNNLSAKDLETEWTVSIVTTNSAKSETLYGASEQISVAEYCEKVIMGEAQNVTDMDVNVAAALLNYGEASATALNTTTATQPTKTVVEKWDGKENGNDVGWYNSVLSGEGTKDLPYIIDTAEKLAYVCTQATDTADKYYKVDESIKAFDMNTSGIDLSGDNVTAQQVKTLLADKQVKKAWTVANNYTSFDGNFDGNGVEIYGLRAGNAVNTNGYNGGYSSYPALFCIVDTSKASFKNLTIKSSYFVGSSSAGALIGMTTKSGGSVSIENCKIANCYISSTNASSDAGVIGGYFQNSSTDHLSDKVLINNCIVYGNVVENQSGRSPYLIGILNAWHYDGSNNVFSPEHFSIKNTVAIDCDIASTQSYWTAKNDLYSNCYTTGTNT